MVIRISTRARVAAAAAVLLAAGVTTTLAAFTDDGSVTTTVASGTLDLKFDADQDGNPSAYAITFTGADNMKPGQSVSKVLKVYNSGSIEALVDMIAPTLVNQEASPAVALEDYLYVTIVDDDTNAPVLARTALASASFDDLDVGATASDARNLRITIELDSSATTAIAGQTVDITLHFEAEQKP